MPRKTCSWGVCKNNSRKEGLNGVTYKKFPQPGTQRERCLEWIRRCGRPHDQLNINCVGHYHYICSEHFEDGEENPVFACPYSKTPKSRKRKTREECVCGPVEKKRQINDLSEVKEGSIVTEQPSSSENISSREADNLPILPKLYSPVKGQASTSVANVATIDCIRAAPSPKKAKINTINGRCPFTLECKNCKSSIRLDENDLKTIGRQRFEEEVKKNDVNCFHYTGIPTVATLWYIYLWLLPFMSIIKLGPGPRKSNKKRKALNYFQEFLLTLVRIRRGYDVKHLSFLFGISPSHVSRIFNAWVKFLSEHFVHGIRWPTQEINKKNLPSSFKDFSNTIAIIDCTEYYIQKPLRPHAQRLTYSTYKHANTFKQLISIMPTGAITFLSKLYAGNISDQAIVKCSGLLNFLHQGDDVMADRGFNINHLLVPKKVTLNIPAFSHGRCLSLKGVKKSRKIASVRIFVEHAIRRMKTFKILSGILPLRFRFQLNSITIIVAFLCNLQKQMSK